ncbi:unnamed protein product [Amoebophrya sp. A25]|nr:unnamed protein product [Amoebophrya sp. A25]|eukprot:GSA25T00001511001.1
MQHSTRRAGSTSATRLPVAPSPLWGTDAWVDLWSGYRYPLQEPGTLPAKIQRVFSENQKLDFPLITEICELAEKRPYEIADSVKILAQALRENTGAKLKVVTLLNEMVYSMYVVYCVVRDTNLMQMIRRLQQKGAHLSSYATQVGSSDEEMANNIRMFSCEIEKKVREEQVRAVAPPKVKPRHIDISFSRKSQTGAGGMAAQQGGGMAAQQGGGMAAQQGGGMAPQGGVQQQVVQQLSHQHQFGQQQLKQQAEQLQRQAGQLSGQEFPRQNYLSQPEVVPPQQFEQQQQASPPPMQQQQAGPPPMQQQQAGPPPMQQPQQPSPGGNKVRPPPIDVTSGGGSWQGPSGSPPNSTSTAGGFSNSSNTAGPAPPVQHFQYSTSADQGTSLVAPHLASQPPQTVGVGANVGAQPPGAITTPASSQSTPASRGGADILADLQQPEQGLGTYDSSYFGGGASSGTSSGGTSTSGPFGFGTSSGGLSHQGGPSPFGNPPSGPAAPPSAAWGASSTAGSQQMTQGASQTFPPPNTSGLPPPSSTSGGALPPPGGELLPPGDALPPPGASETPAFVPLVADVSFSLDPSAL